MVYRVTSNMCLPGLPLPSDDDSSDEGAPAEDLSEDDVVSVSDGSVSDSNVDNRSANSWMDENVDSDDHGLIYDRADDYNSGNEYYLSDNEAISISDDSTNNSDVVFVAERVDLDDDDSSDDVEDLAPQNGEIDDSEAEDEEEDDVVAAFISASSDKNRDHPPDLSIGSSVSGFTIGGLSFHPKENVIAVGLSSGDIAMYKYSNEKNEHVRTHDNIHLKKIIVTEFDDTGENIYSVCKDNVSVSDVETGQMRFYFEKPHGASVTAFSFIDKNTFATGDEDGVVNVWDIRTRDKSMSIKKTEDSINSMITVNNSSNLPTLACASGDGTLTIVDISTKRMVVQSEPYKSGLTSCITMKRNTKLVCGTGKGSLITFNTGDYSAFNDEFPCVDKDASINKLVPVTENILIGALDNGKIRATNMFPNCHLGIVGQHRDSVDLMDISNNGCLLASTASFSNIVKFWNIKFFEDFDVKVHLKKVGTNEFNLPSSNVSNATDFFSGLQ